MLASQTIRIKHYKLEQLKCDEWLALQIINTVTHAQYSDFVEAVKTGVIPCEIFNAFNEDKIDIQRNQQTYYYLENHALFQRKMEQFKYDGQDLLKEPPMQQAVSTLARAIVVITHQHDSQMIDVIMHQTQAEAQLEQGEEEEEFIDVPTDSVQQMTIQDAIQPQEEDKPLEDQPQQETELQVQDDAQQPAEEQPIPEEPHLQQDAPEAEPNPEHAADEAAEEPQPVAPDALIESAQAPQENRAEFDIIDPALQINDPVEPNTDLRFEDVVMYQEQDIVAQAPFLDQSASNPPDFQPITLMQQFGSGSQQLSATPSELAFPLPAPQPNLQTVVSKIALIGPSGCGKTSLLRRFANQSFSQSTKATASLDIVQLNFSANNKNYKLTAYDTAGQEQFSSVLGSQVQKAELVLLCFDVGNQNSFQALDKWFTKCGKTGSAVVLCGLQCDKNVSVTEDEIATYCKPRGIEKFVICSSKSGAGISAIFQDIWLQGTDDEPQTVRDEAPLKKGCCQ